MDYDSSHLICFSPTHSSHLIGESIIRGLSTEHASETDLTYEGVAQPLQLGRELTVIAVPVYGGRVAETALERMELIQGNQTPVILVVVYGNRDYDDALLELKDWSCSHGFWPVAAGAFIGEHSYSRDNFPIAAHRPDEQDLAEALAFGKQVRHLLEEAECLSRLGELGVKGNYPYKVKGPKTPQAPLTDQSRCTLCGFCVEICPVQAICQKEEIVTDAGVCIKCCACVKQCPGQARIFNTPYTEMLFKNFTTRRAPELYFSGR